MTHEELKQQLCERGYEDSVVFENPSYDDAVIGISLNGNVVYSYEKMIDSLMKEDGISEDEAIDFIDYNTVRTLEYIQADSRLTPPIIVLDIEP